MIKKYFRHGGILFLMLVVLSGCIENANPEAEVQEELGPDEVTVQTTSNQLSDDYYRAVILDGQYQLGASASADNTVGSTRDAEAFEEGLLTISKDVFPTDQYYLQEGQLINEDLLTSWTSRESEENPEGLNPAIPSDAEEPEEEGSSDESVDPAEDPEDPEEEESEEENPQVAVDPEIPPIYLSQIMEKNIMVETDEGFSLSGVVIGLAMNSTYEYTDENGVVYEHEISMGEMRERGRQYANIIVGRLRETEELRSIPIVVGIYGTSGPEDTVGGTYILDGISREGNSVTDWQEHNEYRQALPIVDESGTNEEYAYFDNFASDVRNFFPNLNGISGEAYYIDGGLASLTIEVVSQFYQQTEITALTQYITDAAQRHLPEGVAVEIQVVSAAGAESVVSRPAGSTQYDAIIFQ